MKRHDLLENVTISRKAHLLLEQLLRENPQLGGIMRNASTVEAVHDRIKDLATAVLESNPLALEYYRKGRLDACVFDVLRWRDFAAVRLLDYVDNADREIVDPNLRGKVVKSNPIKLIWLAVNKGTGGTVPDFFKDMIALFRQLNEDHDRRLPSRDMVEKWMDRYPSGLEPRILAIREKNKERILRLLIKKIETGEIVSRRYSFEPGQSDKQKFSRALEWWKETRFHLRFACRSPEFLDELLGGSLSPETMTTLYEAQDAGIPFFINPYYLSLLNVHVPYFAVGTDQAIRDYIIYSNKLVAEFGHIVAWEKEDLVEPGKPNAAGWLLPSRYNVHRRYPDLAILIPDTLGRACGGLCASCQRMYDFQNGHLNFDLDKLSPTESWPEKLAKLMAYFENDSQIRDILITGGDAFMHSDKALNNLLQAVYEMALRKKRKNASRTDGEKFAEMVRVRLGTRLPVYMPQRITDKTVQVLSDFRDKASRIGMKQFIVQTHFQSSMEVTPEAKEAVSRIISAGWMVTNQLVLTVAASRRGHTVKLRKVLNDIGVLSYYTFSVKGYMENEHLFATNARSVQEQLEEKVIGTLSKAEGEALRNFADTAQNSVANIDKLRNRTNLPFLATDRNMLNLPGVGKSLSFRTVGITRDGRRILEFDHDPTRAHSPVIEKMGKLTIIESKSMNEYLRQLDEMGEDVAEYEDVYGYSIGETQGRMAVYEYPEYDFEVTREITNLQLGEAIRGPRDSEERPYLAPI
jgi:lysine 2,3-aminomutase